MKGCRVLKQSLEQVYVLWHKADYVPQGCVSGRAPDKERSMLKWAYSRFQVRSTVRRSTGRSQMGSTVTGFYARCRLTAVATPLRGNSARPIHYPASTLTGVGLPCV